jgi:hypothetical protein
MNGQIMDIATDAITPAVAYHAIHFRDSNLGHSGGFISDHLFEFMIHLDSGKLLQLSLAFPAEVAAFRLSKTESGLQMLVQIASTLTLVR